MPVMAEISVLPIGTASPSVGGLVATALRARERPDSVFWATVVAAVGVSTVGLFAAIQYGVTRAISGLVCANALQTVAMLWLLRK